MRAMTKEEFEQYRILVQRKGKAMAVPRELRLGKYSSEYQKIVSTLREEFQSYVAYYITDGKNNLLNDVGIAAEIKNQKSIFSGINTALYDGDLKKMDKYCDRLKTVYEDAIRVKEEGNA